MLEVPTLVARWQQVAVPVWFAHPKLVQKIELDPAIIDALLMALSRNRRAKQRCSTGPGPVFLMSQSLDPLTALNDQILWEHTILAFRLAITPPRSTDLEQTSNGFAVRSNRNKRTTVFPRSGDQAMSTHVVIQSSYLYTLCWFVVQV